MAKRYRRRGEDKTNYKSSRDSSQKRYKVKQNFDDTFEENEEIEREIKKLEKGYGKKNKVNRKPVIISCVCGVIIAIILLVLYYVYNMKIGGEIMHGSDTFKVSSSEDGELIFPMNFNFVNIDGDKVKLSDNKSEYYIVNFWNNQTSASKVLFENFGKFKTATNPQIYHVNVGDSRTVVKDLLKSEHVSILKDRVFFDYDNKMLKELGISGMPAFIIVRSDGIILDTISKEMTIEEAIIYYEEIVKKEEVSKESEHGNNVTDDNATEESFDDLL